MVHSPFKRWKTCNCFHTIFGYTNSVTVLILFTAVVWYTLKVFKEIRLKSIFFLSSLCFLSFCFLFLYLFPFYLFLSRSLLLMAKVCASLFHFSAPFLWWFLLGIGSFYVISYTCNNMVKIDIMSKRQDCNLNRNAMESSVEFTWNTLK